MKRPKSKDASVADSLRGLGTRFALLFFVIVTLGMLILGKTDPRAIENSRTIVIDSLSPVMAALSEPVTAFHAAIDWGEDVALVFRENQRLREENHELREWRQLAQRLAEDNARFRALLKVQPDRTLAITTARVIADTGGSFVRSVIINAGRNKGVTRGQPVLDEMGVVGRVVETGKYSARVLLVTDLNSRVPVKISESGFNAILAGDNKPMAKLIFMPVGAEIRVGDHVATSGHGGIFPPDLVVGRIASISKSGEIRVLLTAELGRLNYVRLFSYTAPPTPAPTPETPPETLPGSEIIPGTATPDGAATSAPTPAPPALPSPGAPNGAPGAPNGTPAPQATPGASSAPPAPSDDQPDSEAPAPPSPATDAPGPGGGA